MACRLKAARATFNHAGEEANHVDHIAGHFDPVVDRGLPAWPHGSSWGYGPSGIVGTLLIVLVVLIVMGRV